MAHDEFIPLQLWHPELAMLLAEDCLPLSIDDADEAERSGIHLSHAAEQACLMSAYLRIESYLATHPNIDRIAVEILTASGPYPETLIPSLFDKNNNTISGSDHPILIHSLEAMISRIGVIVFCAETIGILGEDVFGASAYRQWMALRERHELSSTSVSQPRASGSKTSL